MQVGRLGALVGFGCQILAAGAAWILPDQTWIGWSLFIFGGLILIVAFIWWFRANRAQLKNWIKRMEPVHVIAIGLMIAVGGLIWLLYRGPANRSTSATLTQDDITSATATLQAELNSTKQQLATAQQELHKHQAAQQNAIPSSKQAGPIEWAFNDIVGPNTATDGTFLVGALNFRGKNVSGEPITKVDAYFIPQISGKRVPLMFYDAHAPALLETRDHVIPPDAEFQLSYRLPTYDKDKSPQGVPVEEFLANYGGITFVFDYNGNQTFKHEFRYPALRDYLLSQQRDHEQSRKQPPGVRKISE